MNPGISILACASFIVGVVGLAITPPDVVDPSWPVVQQTVHLPLVVDAVPPADPVIAPYEGPGCAMWAPLALEAGFTPSDLPVALQVMELESRCLPDVVGDNGDSFGLMQINRFWCEPSRYWPTGYLQAFSLVEECADLMNPRTNLVVAWHIAANHGWPNWSTFDRIDK